MTKIELENIKKNRRWTVTFTDIYSRFFFIVFPLAIVFIGTATTIAGLKNNLTDLIITAIIILIVGLLLTAFVVKRLYQNQTFDCIQTKDLTNEKIESALKFAELNNIKHHVLGYYTATTKVSWFSWGEQITIVIADNEVLINSRPTGSSFSFQPITLLKDRQNIKTLINELQLSISRD